MTTLIVAVACFIGGYFAHKAQWHLKAYKKGKTAFEEWEKSREE